MPSSLQAHRIRSAISPRLAITIFSSMWRLFDDEQWLAEFDRVAVTRHDRGDAAGLVALDLVHHFHGFYDAEHLRYLLGRRCCWRHAADAHAFLPFFDLDLGDAGFLQQLDEFLDFSDIHARHSPLGGFGIDQLAGLTV